MKRSALLIALFAACGSKPAPEPMMRTNPEMPLPPPLPTRMPTAPTGPTKQVTSRTLQSIGLDPTALDRKADPCDDFYQFACGGWIAKTEIPADKPMAMRSFIDIEDRNLDYEHDLLDKARTAPASDKLMTTVGSFYGSCMDEATIEKAGIKPVQPLLAIVSKVSDVKSLSNAIAQLHVAGFSALFAMGSTQDAADATTVIAGIDQAGLGLPDRDYYSNTDDESVKLRAKYQDFVAANLVASGMTKTEAAKRAVDILALETAIALVHKDKVLMRDPKGTYNRLDRDGVAKAMPHFDWNGFWATLGIKDIKQITTSAPDFLVGVDKLLVSTKPEIWRAYLTAYVMRGAASFLTPELEKASFDFSANMTGQKEQTPRWKRCVERTDGALGDVLGQIFVRDKFGGDSKPNAESLVHAIVGAMGGNLAALPWMDAATKTKANEKLAKMAYQIGYPAKWKTYNFKVDLKTWGANALASAKAEQARDLAKIGKPVDHDDWGMTTPTVNAYYNPALNVMVFPAGILQPPFYSVDASIAVNLGAMGVVVGHELTHGFDDQGAQYDADGNLKDWWQPDTMKQFQQRTKCVIDQYSTYPIADTKVNGANTVGENIADIGGVKLALGAYRSLRAPANDTIVADGFTEDQQFFLGFGQAWCAKATPQIEKLLANTDVHSPAKWRVNGALQATPEFAKVWGCKQNVRMAPAKACTVW